MISIILCILIYIKRQIEHQKKLREKESFNKNQILIKEIKEKFSKRNNLELKLEIKKSNSNDLINFYSLDYNNQDNSYFDNNSTKSNILHTIDQDNSNFYND